MENTLVNRTSKTLEKTLLTIIRWGTYFALLTPLIVMSKFFYSFIVPKTTYFRIIVEIIFAAYLVLILSFPKYRPKINFLSVAVFIFILVSVIACITGVDFQRSFWSTYEREAGLFTLLHLYAFFIVLSNAFKERKDWEKLFFGSAVVGFFVALSAVSAGSIAKGGGTIGNTSFLGAYLLFDIFFAIAIFLKKKFSGLGIFASTSLLIFIPVLFSISAKGATVSFFGGLFLLFLGLAFFSKEKKLKIISIAIPIVLILIGVSLALYSSKIQSLIASNLREMNARIIVWGIAWKGFLERPILGWGLENYNVVFAKFFSPKLFLKEYGGEFWFDKAHDVVLDTLIQSGIVGLISYLSIFFISIFSLFKKCFSENKENIGTNLTIISLLIAYFVQNLLVFDVISSYVTFFLTLAFVNFLIKEGDVEKEGGFIVNSFLKNFSYLLIFVFTSFCLYFGNIQPANGAINTVTMIRSKDFEEKIKLYEKASKELRYHVEINRQFSSALITEAFNPKANKKILQKAIGLSEKEDTKDIQENPLDFRSYITLVRVYIAGYGIDYNNYYLDRAEKVLNEAIKISPNNQQSYWYLADVKYKQGDFNSAISLLKKSISLEPRLKDSYWYLASTYMMNKQYDEALNVMKEAEKGGVNWKDNLSDFKKLISIYSELKNYQVVTSLYKELLTSYPKDSRSWFGFAISLFNTGDKEGAKKAAQKAIQINPNLQKQATDTFKLLLQ